MVTRFEIRQMEIKFLGHQFYNLNFKILRVTKGPIQQQSKL